MTTTVIGVRLTAEGGGLVSELKGVKAELTGVASAEKSAATAAGEVSRSTRDMAAAADAAAAAMRSATAATNGMGGGFSANAADIGKSSGLAKHHVQNLAFQAQDLGVQLAAAAGSSEPFKMAMMALFQQGSQVSGIMSQAGIGVGGLLAQIGKFALAAAPAIVAVGVLAAGVGILTSEINKNSSVTVTWQDTVLGAYDAAKSYISGQMTAAFKAFGIETSDVWAKVVDVTKWALNWMIGSVTVVPRILITAFKVLPAAIGDVFYSAVNGAIGAINGLVEQAVSILNGFAGLVNPILEKVGLSIPMLLAPKIAPLKNAYAGAAAIAGTAFVETLKGTVTTDYLGNAAAAISPFAQDRARKRIAEDAKKAGKGAGSAAGKAAGDAAGDEFSRAFSDALKDASKFADTLGKGLDTDLKKQTAGMWDEIAASQAEATDRITASSGANADWNKQLRDTVRLLDQVGGFGGVLGDIGSAVDAVRTGDFSSLGGPAGQLLKTISGAQWTGMDDQGRYTRTLGEVFNNSLDKVFGSNGSFGQTMQNAGLGMSASRIVLGDRGGASSIGSAIGGALGEKVGTKFLSKGLESIAGGLGGFAGPLGSILGGVLGGALGGLTKKTTSGFAVVSNTGVSSGGNDNKLAANAQASGDSISGALNGIADRLGATIGNYAVSIGMRSSGWVSVSGSGSSSVADKNWKKSNVGGDLLYDGEDPEQALKVAIQNAIQDGAIEGVSAAVKKALGSSSDIDAALREALKVADVELLVGGIGAELEKSFRQFENQAKERLRIGSEYGFDLVKLEERNAKDRAKLTEKLLKEQAGSLQDLIDQITGGSLFEGSAVDQRDVLLEKIKVAQADANAGVEGAADKLASLFEQLNSVSRDAFGTTGAFAADRAAIIDGSQQAIDAAKKRVEDAQKATDPALAETNTQLDEANDQLAKLAASSGLTADFLKAISAKLDNGGYAGLLANAGFR